MVAWGVRPLEGGRANSEGQWESSVAVGQVWILSALAAMRIYTHVTRVRQTYTRTVSAPGSGCDMAPQSCEMLPLHSLGKG